MKRKRLAAVLAALTLAVGVSACQGNGPGATKDTGSDSGSAKTIKVYASGDTNIQDLWQKTLIPAYEKANPDVKVVLQFDLHGENSSQVIAKLAAATQQKKDPGIDLVEGVGKQAGQAGLLADPKPKVPNLANVDSKVVAAAGTNAIPYRGSSVLLAYNADKVTDPPKTLDELLAWIKAHPGKFAYNSPKTGGSGGAFVTTVLDKYVPADVREKMTTGYDKDLEKYWEPGWKTLAGLNPYVFQKGVYPNGNNGTIDLLSSGQIWMLPVWSDQFLSGQANGTIPKTAKIAQISNPTFTGGSTEVGVVKASSNQEPAFAMANWLLEPDQQKAIAEKIAGYPVISLDKLPAEVQEEFKDAKPDQLRPGYNSDHGNDINNLWDQKVPGH
ncbi:extracellular solute-binding protein [Microlunatus panaciterrae]|uniref:Spermidine/putrescine transport system substrate-binding protein n=1 Tax=Microlunatus panaciterrae TaxID=400768 RepID=A0ABS2RLQ3_9ACTN|nr:extracellular solute-binding protein [Microlunatus panaciterrae]MBM7799946.1 putative spermidine/putrescine transport system substrate-binding protein [Microlunatus panaciterrae]